MVYVYINVLYVSYRNLREARDMAISEKDRAVATERETSTKYEQLLTEYVLKIQT